MVKLPFAIGDILPDYYLFMERNLEMATCEICGKKTTFGHNRSHSMRATRRTFSPNLQTISVFEEGKKVRRVLCAKCIRSLVKSK